MLQEKGSFNYLVLIFPLILLISLVLLALSAGFKENAELLSLALSFDFLITIPLIYFLIIRKSKIPATTIIPLMVIGLLAGKYTIPQEYHFYLDSFQSWALPVLEISVISMVIFRVYRTIQAYKINREGEADFYNALKTSCREILPKAFAIPFATEIAVFYYGFFHWKKKDPKENEYSYHKDSGSVSLYAVIIFLIIIETLVLHILISLWLESLAWLISILSIYTGLQLFGFLRSIYKRPILIEEDKLLLRYGIMKEAEISLSDIAAIEISDRDIEEDASTLKLALLEKLESHNIILHLHREQNLTGIYGRTKKFRVIAFHVDDKENFRRKIEAAIF
ncbi:hypothetical protein GCM10023115_30800 [Pontixanthobacter gangjinensis]|uniref:Beta-carotene 15,15'-monooxygenase n=1 Tax=Christiangramia aestuarii TaxID=1028746 RepID=A0A7K1LND6_9FLAO|nr:hypothetical protein [Christiangramia aestuarii]MUP42312.1 hypothetical protein [Christiangramia aestuarii]